MPGYRLPRQDRYCLNSMVTKLKTLQNVPKENFFSLYQFYSLLIIYENIILDRNSTLLLFVLPHQNVYRKCVHRGLRRCGVVAWGMYAKLSTFTNSCKIKESVEYLEILMTNKKHKINKNTDWIAIKNTLILISKKFLKSTLLCGYILKANFLIEKRLP